MNLFRQPTAEELARRQLAEARINLLEHQRLAEYHSAIESMLKARIKRLESDIDDRFVRYTGADA